MGFVHRHSNPGSGSTEYTAFIQCVDCQEPQIHELWCLVLGNITSEVHPTAQVEVIDGTIEEFVTDYLAKNGRKIQIIRKLSVNDSVQLLGVIAQSWGGLFPFIFNLKAPVEATGWVIGNYYNQYWGGRISDAHSITHIAWGASVDAIPANLSRIPVNPRAA